MAGKTFISYRRDDAAGDARGIRDALVAKFGRANVFMDIDNLLAGQRFDKELSKALDACDVLIAIIGPRWVDQMTARTQSGERDYVREEIAAALRRDIVVIPVRVGLEGRMPPLPRGAELPADIRDLVLHQKHDVAHERFGRDVRELIEAIEAAFDERERETIKPMPVLRASPAPESTLPTSSSAQADTVHQDAVKPAPVLQAASPVESRGPPPLRADAIYDRKAQEDKGQKRFDGSLWIRVVAALIAALGLGYTIAYTYRSLVPLSRAPVVVADRVPTKVMPEPKDRLLALQADDTKLASREEDPTGDKPRRVKTMPVTPATTPGLPNETPMPPTVPGILLENLGPRPAASATTSMPSPPTKVTSTQPAQPPSAPASTTSAIYVAVLSTQKTRMDALRVFADLQQKYGEVLAGKTPDVREVELKASGLGTVHRLLVGPPGSRDTASGFCTQIKAAGYKDCWVTAY